MTTDSTANRRGLTAPDGAMTQQTVVALRDSECFPQGFVRLIGHRHPDAHPFSWIKSKPNAAPPLAPGSADVNAPIG